MTMINRVIAKALYPSPLIRRNRVIAAGLFVGFIVSSFLGGVTAAAADDSLTLRSQKTLWQERYKGLLDRAEELRVKVEVERELYADANRRNYRRGTKRHVHNKAMKEAASELVSVESELARIEDDGRRSGALPGWFYEVDLDRKAEALRPSIPAGPGEEGRNPLYLKDPSAED